MAKPLEAEKNLDKRVARRTRGKDNFEYLVQWKDKPIEDSTWLSLAEL